jgi:tRNA(Ile)-lysidine synthase
MSTAEEQEAAGAPEAPAASAAPADNEPIGIKEARTLLGIMPKKRPLILAVSGGPDSVALMRLAASVFCGRELRAFTIDHGLRPLAAAEAEAVGRWAAEIGIPHDIVKVDWEGQVPKTGVQEAAREKRFLAFALGAWKHGIRDIVTAHHADDQAETVLMRFAAGSGPAGLAAMRPRSTLFDLTVWRPFLGVPKSRLIATLRAGGHPWFDDPSNSSEQFARGRWRQAMPMLEREGLTRDRLLTLARRAARADNALDLAAGKLFDRHARVMRPGVKMAPGWLGEHEEFVLRMIEQAASCVRDDGEPLRLERLESLGAALIASAQAGTYLSRTLGGCRFTLERDGSAFISKEPERRRGLRKG